MKPQNFKQDVESRLCDIRNMLEELANDCMQYWADSPNEIAVESMEQDYESLSDDIQDIADQVAVLEDNMFKELWS